MSNNGFGSGWLGEGPLRILLVDDHTILRQGIRMLLENMGGIEVIGEASNGLGAIEEVGRLKPDLVIMDIAMGKMNGIDATRQIKKQFNDVKVLILTMHDNEEYLLELLEAGASGYVLKKAAATELADAIKLLMQGESFIYPSNAKQVVEGFFRNRKRFSNGNTEILTPREKEILTLIGEGYSNRQIANMLVISVKTVENHRTHIMRKLNLHDRVEIVRYAMMRGFVSSGD